MFDQLNESERLALATPAGFVYRVLLEGRKKLAPWQGAFLNKFRDPRRVVRATLSTPNGSGKSSIIVAGLGLYTISMFDKAKFVIVSFDSKQLDHQCWPSITQHRNKFENDKGWRFIEREVHTPEGGFIIGFTTDDPGRAEGWHKIDDLDGPLVMLFDEAKSIDNRVFDAGNRCTYNGQGYVSSPGLNEGRFFDSHTILKKTKENPTGFETMKVGLADCPWIPKERIDSTIAEYGIDHPFTQSTLFGEFMDADADTMFIVPKSVMKGAQEARPPYIHGGRAAFVAGRNENVISFKEGNKVEQICWRDHNVMSSIGRCLVEFNKRGLLPSETYGDAGGMGVAIISRFHEMGWPIVAVNNDDDAVNPIYENKGAEDWHEGSKKMHDQSYIIPDDPILYKQATSRRIKFTSDGELGAESKKDMAKRNVESPDRADSLFGVLGVDTSLAAALLDETGLRKLESVARGSVPERMSLVLAGKDVTTEVGGKEAWLDIWERPIVGRNYLCVVNPVWHDDAFGHHVVIVLRAGYSEGSRIEGKDVIAPARLVAKVRKPCRLDAGPLAQSVLSLTRYYGDCYTIPIQNERGDVIDELLKAGVSVYAKEDFEHIRHGKENTMIQFGWEPNEYNRSLWIGALAEVVRNGRLDVGDIESVMQMFQVDGRNSKVKRDAEAIGVGMKEIVRASRYTRAPEGIFKEVRKPNLAKAMFS
jgi:hypothetical protein